MPKHVDSCGRAGGESILSASSSAQRLGFLAAGSATGRDILRHDWSANPLGPLEGWPASLRSTLAMMLACPAPMYLAWGPDLVSLFNDAYRPILGLRLSQALGEPFPQVWDHIWEQIKPTVDIALSGRGAAFEDMKFDLRRQGVPEESWWDFSYSPVYDDDGAVAGMICVSSETTGRVLAERARAAADERLQMALAAGNSIGTWDWDVTTDRMVADRRFARIFGIDPDDAAAGVPIAAFIGHIHPDDADRVRAAIDTAMRGFGAYRADYRLLDAEGRLRWLAARGQPVADADGRCVRFPGVAYDITDLKAAEEGLRAAKDERDFVIALAARQRVLHEPDAIMDVTCEALARRLAVTQCGFYRMVDVDRVHYGPSWTEETLAPLSGELALALNAQMADRHRGTGTPLIFGAGPNCAPPPDDLAAVGVAAGIAVPLLRDDQWQVGFVVLHRAPRAWSDGEIALVREVADLSWLAVERVEALLRLEHRVERQGDALLIAADSLRTEAESRAVAEDQVRQLQKMEAIGQLTGGIAHDFNNMLAVIIGGLNLLQRRLKRGETDVGRYIDGAMDGAMRAAALTQRLLAFSRQQPLAPEPVDADAMIAGMADLLGRTLGEEVKIETIRSVGLWKARADPNQLENALINLSVNARDAMPGGGRLTIETQNAPVDEASAASFGIPSGQYVLIAVTDNGTGMTPDVVARAFDPFFTTKAIGKGTGLGLAQVFGFARQSGGHIKIYSKVGHGSTFMLYLPRYYGDAPAEARVPMRAPLRPGHPSEIVLVVEDEERVRQFSVEALRELGYTVLHAASGAEAMALIEGGQDVTLLFTDIVMPGMTGRQLAERALERLPRMKVVYTTGYARNAAVQNGVIDPGTNFLAKPFGLDQLAAKLRGVIEG